MNIREIVSDYLGEKSDGEIAVTAVENGGDALSEALAGEYDLLLLDVMLPEVDGFTICRELRCKSDIPIFFSPPAAPRTTDYVATIWAAATIL